MMIRHSAANHGTPLQYEVGTGQQIKAVGGGKDMWVVFAVLLCKALHHAVLSSEPCLLPAVNGQRTSLSRSILRLLFSEY